MLVLGVPVSCVLALELVHAVKVRDVGNDSMVR